MHKVKNHPENDKSLDCIVRVLNIVYICKEIIF